MLDLLKIAAAEVGAHLIRPRIEKAKTDLKLAVITGVVVGIFSLLAFVCLFLIVFLHLTQYMPPENAALALFGFSLLMCIGAVLMYVIGRAVEQKVYERKLTRPLRDARDDLPKRGDLDIGEHLQDMFAENKGAALIAAAVAGIVLGAKPGLVLRSVSKIVAGKAVQRRRRR